MHWEIEYVLFSLGYSPAAAQVGELSLQRWAAFLSAAAAAPAGLPGAQDRSSSSLGPWQELGELSCPAALPALLLPFHACLDGDLGLTAILGSGVNSSWQPCASPEPLAGKLVLSTPFNQGCFQANGCCVGKLSSEQLHTHRHILLHTGVLLKLFLIAMQETQSLEFHTLFKSTHCNW